MNCTGEHCPMQYDKVNPEICGCVKYCQYATPPDQTNWANLQQQTTKILNYILGVMRAYDEITASGCCNDCNNVKTCMYKPELGKLVRYNCPFYVRMEGAKNEDF